MLSLKSKAIQALVSYDGWVLPHFLKETSGSILVLSSIQLISGTNTTITEHMTQRTTPGIRRDPSGEGLKTPNLPLLDLSRLNMDVGLTVVNRTKRFVFNVPVLVNGGEPLVAPDGVVRKTVPEVQLKDPERVIIAQGSLWKETLDGSREPLPGVYPDRGVIFWNHVDRCWQAVRGNGKESILFTDVTPEQAAQMHDYIKRAGEAKLSSPAVIQKLLDFADSIGLGDRQNKKTEQVEREMRVINPELPGYMVVTKDVQHQAVFVPAGFTAATSRRPSFPQGAVVLSDGKYRWTIDTGVFVRNFKEVRGDVEGDLSSADLSRCTADLTAISSV